MPAFSRQTGQSPCQHIWFITGPAGCGKTTVANGLSKEFGLPFLEADNYHTKSNKDKMANGIPLNDQDRWDWLISLRQAALSVLAPPSHTPPSHTPPSSSSSSSSFSSSSSSSSSHSPSTNDVIITCSALRRKYRDVLRIATYGHPNIRVHFIYLRLTEDELMRRVQNREGHYMKASMVRSQFSTLEEPGEEEWDAVSIDCGSEDVGKRPDAILKRVMDVVKEEKEADSAYTEGPNRS